MEKDAEPAVASHRFQAWAEIGQETGQLHGGKRRGGVTRPLRNGRQKSERQPWPPGLAGQRHSTHSSSLEPMPETNSSGYGCSWWDSDAGVGRQDRVTFP